MLFMPYLFIMTSKKQPLKEMNLKIQQWKPVAHGIQTGE